MTQEPAQVKAEWRVSRQSGVSIRARLIGTTIQYEAALNNRIRWMGWTNAPIVSIEKAEEFFDNSGYKVLERTF